MFRRKASNENRPGASIAARSAWIQLHPLIRFASGLPVHRQGNRAFGACLRGNASFQLLAEDRFTSLAALTFQRMAGCSVN